MRNSLSALLLLAASYLFLPVTAQAHDYVDLDTFLEMNGMDLDSVEITTQEIGEGLYILFGSGGNIVASIGEQGTLVVDSMFAELVPKIQTTVRELGGNDITFTVNTHFHFDHANGNPLFSRSGSWVVTHNNARRSMTEDRPIDLVAIQYLQPAYPKDALPVITYDDSMRFHFNNEVVELLHFSPAHTSGDSAVYFRGANVIHMGDVFNASYPFIDAGNGGDIDGMIEFCREILHLINEDTGVLPGHGPLLGYQDLADFIDMLVTVRDRIAFQIDTGASLEEVIASNPTQEFDDRYGDPTLLINRAYMTLAQ